MHNEYIVFINTAILSIRSIFPLKLLWFVKETSQLSTSLHSCNLVQPKKRKKKLITYSQKLLLLYQNKVWILHLHVLPLEKQNQFHFLVFCNWSDERIKRFSFYTLTINILAGLLEIKIINVINCWRNNQINHKQMREEFLPKRKMSFFYCIFYLKKVTVINHHCMYIIHCVTDAREIKLVRVGDLLNSMRGQPIFLYYIWWYQTKIRI